MNDKSNIERPQKPDKSLFMAMMGAFFLCFAIAPAYWAFYNYGEYNQAKNFVQELKSKSEQFLTPDEKKEKESRIYFLEARTDRYNLEMILSGIGSFILFGIAILLLAKSFKARNRKNFYHETNWSERPMPTVRLEIEYKNLHNILLIGIGAFFVLTPALIFYQTSTSRFSTTREITVKGAFCLFLIAFALFLVFPAIRARRQVVKTFDASGVTRGDGRHFRWAEFCGVVMQTARNRFGQTYIWRKELAFSDGETAWIIPNRIKNYDEVSEYISRLPQAVLKEVK